MLCDFFKYKFINITKAVCFNNKLNQAQKYYNQAMNLKMNLNNKIQNYGIDDVEAFMRNNFKMAGKNEIRIDIIED